VTLAVVKNAELEATRVSRQEGMSAEQRTMMLEAESRE